MGLLSRILIAGSTPHPRKCLKTAGQDGKVKQSAGAPAAALLLSGRHRFTFSCGGGGSDQYAFDRGLEGQEEEEGEEGAQILAGGEASGGGGTRSRLQRLLWKYFSNCWRRRIDQCGAPKQTFARPRQYGMERWQLHWHAEFSTMSQPLRSPPPPTTTKKKKKNYPKWKINRNFAVCVDPQISRVTLQKLCNTQHSFLFFWHCSICSRRMVGFSSPFKKATLL